MSVITYLHGIDKHLCIVTLFVCFSASKFSIHPKHIVLVHDELDKPLGKLAIKHGGSARSETLILNILHRGKETSVKIEPFFMSYDIQLSAITL